MLIELDDVCSTVGVVLGKRGVSPDLRIMEDLGAESMDILNVMVTLEQKYSVSIDEASMSSVSTVRDLYNLLLTSGPSQRLQ
jgi:acyl carrier protein